ncbi:MAG: hypothetical protein JXM73_09025 [Anaerolineae bacterium]|nr:hypothetical protein [Anaerolineae bacterium]
MSAKLLLPIVALMLVSLLVGTLAFVAGTVLTQNQLLRQMLSSLPRRAAL